VFEHANSSIWGAYVLLTPAAALAQTAPEELRKIARNPFAAECRLPFEEDFTFSQGPYDRGANSFAIQSVIPLLITGDWHLLMRVAGRQIKLRALLAGGTMDG
jgi:hypothetical protein